MTGLRRLRLVSETRTLSWYCWTSAFPGLCDVRAALSDYVEKKFPRDRMTMQWAGEVNFASSRLRVGSGPDLP